MKKLLSCMQAFGKGDAAAMSHFGARLAALTVEDLGVYVSGEALEMRTRQPEFDLHRQLFSLGPSLKHFSPASGPLSASVSSQRLSCSTLYEDQLSTLCWFVVPPGHTLPLHDHPCMRVWQRVMFGELRITALDWSPEAGATVPPDVLARRRASEGDTALVVVNETMKGCSGAINPSTLTTFDPLHGGGVLHEIHNAHPTMPALFIDIITPPYYTPPSQWGCTYYTPVDDNGHTVAVASLAVGENVALTPRDNFAGPPMDPYLYVPQRDS